MRGDIVIGNNSGRHAIVLAVRKDGTAAKLYDYGPDEEVWVDVTDFTVEVTGDNTCYKCMGSGLYFMGGMVLNGRYTGKTGPCYACDGKGIQNAKDRIRCHFYWHRKVEAGEEVESPLEPTPQQPLPQAHTATQTAVRPARERKAANIAKARERATKRTIKTAHGERSATPATDAVDAMDLLIDCESCGCVHRSDVKCPW
jgi:hypothetical protein